MPLEPAAGIVTAACETDRKAGRIEGHSRRFGSRCGLPKRRFGDVATVVGASQEVEDLTRQLASEESIPVDVERSSSSSPARSVTPQSG